MIVGYELMHVELIVLHPGVTAPARGQGTVFHVMFTSLHHTLTLDPSLMHSPVVQTTIDGSDS